MISNRKKIPEIQQELQVRTHLVIILCRVPTPASASVNKNN